MKHRPENTTNRYEEILIRVRSIDGTPVRVTALADALRTARCYAVTVPQRGTNCRVRRIVETDDAWHTRSHASAPFITIH